MKEAPLHQLKDKADWTGIVIASVGVQGRTSGYEYGGYRYVTPGEVAIARLLTEQDIPFTPDVQVRIRTPLWKERLPLVYTPDFVFDGQAYIWCDRTGTEEIVHGIEVKGRNRQGRYPRRALEKIKVLREARGINVTLIDESLACRMGALPLTLL